MNGYEKFNKYIGIQGILALALLAGYIAAVFIVVVLPDGYTELMTLVFGFYFAKNGVGLLAAVRGVMK